MIHSGPAFKLSRDENILKLCFDRDDEKVNVFNRSALTELGEVLALVEQQKDVAGLFMISGKPAFIVGADITEFLGYFAAPDDVLETMLDEVNGMFNRFEDLPFPTVVCINGEAQGGGFEICLAADFRVAAEKARVGLPEVKLGIMPGWGGSVRLSRLIGVDNAVEWMCTGNAKKATDALKDGAIDAVIKDGDLEGAAVRIIHQVNEGKIDIQARRALKTGPLTLSELEATMAIESARGVVGAKAGPHYPSPMTIINTVAKHGALERKAALPVETASFVSLAKTDVAESLVGIFLNDQLLKRIARQQSKGARELKRTAVLGAGIMGGGIAYQSASNGTPIVMKDINNAALETGLAEAGQLLRKQVERGRLDTQGMAGVLNGITPALSYGEFGDVGLVVEAVVENPKVKMAVLSEVESAVQDSTIITTNTSTISVDLLATALKRPENFCGMHFFNPVHRMPLVEVIRAKTSSEEAIATTVAYAQAMKKTPIVVNDCPGFLVNRILFAYFGGFNRLIADGASFIAVDRALEKFGWPMGPAYLLDVVGMDTGKHAASVMAEGFPDRMASEGKTVIDALYEAERLGQKNNRGFFQYETDRKGKLKKTTDASVDAVIASVQQSPREFDEQEMVDRLMIPMCIESARCLEDNIVGTASEVDMGLVYGIGFPPFRGGALHYVDKIGLKTFCARADEFSHLGALYHPTAKMRDMAERNASFHSKEPVASGEQA